MPLPGWSFVFDVFAYVFAGFGCILFVLVGILVCYWLNCCLCDLCFAVCLTCLGIGWCISLLSYACVLACWGLLLMADCLLWCIMFDGLGVVYLLFCFYLCLIIWMLFWLVCVLPL